MGLLLRKQTTAAETRKIQQMQIRYTGFQPASYDSYPGWNIQVLTQRHAGGLNRSDGIRAQ
jgi:hypothetical protein